MDGRRANERLGRMHDGLDVGLDDAADRVFDALLADPRLGDHDVESLMMRYLDLRARFPVAGEEEAG